MIITKTKLTKEKLILLKKWSSIISKQYNSQVYLVGSACIKDDYRDVDIVCVISDENFESKYMNVDDWISEGKTGLWSDNRWKWSNECIKIWGECCKQTMLNIDFKIIPEKYHMAESKDNPIYKLND